MKAIKYSDLVQSPVVFDEGAHSYQSPEGASLSGVTSMLGAVIFHSKYDGIPGHVLDQAAARGTAIHASCLLTDLFGSNEADESEHPETAGYLRLKAEHGLKMIAGEYLVSDGHTLATMIDCVDEQGNLYDIKTTSYLDTEYVSWQLSTCAYLYEAQNAPRALKAGKLFAIWLRGERAELVEVERKSTEQILELIEDYKMGIIRATEEPELVQESGAMLSVLDIEREIYAFKRHIDRLEEQKAEALETLRERMQSEGVKKLESPRLMVTLVADSTSTTFDSKRFKAEHPELAKSYEKETTRKGYVKITLKNTDKQTA